MAKRRNTAIDLEHHAKLLKEARKAIEVSKKITERKIRRLSKHHTVLTIDQQKVVAHPHANTPITRLGVANLGAPRTGGWDTSMPSMRDIETSEIDQVPSLDTPGNAPGMGLAVPKPERDNDEQTSVESPRIDTERGHVKPLLSTPVGIPAPQGTSTTTNKYQRDPAVKEWVLREANGCCECCKRPAPFLAQDGAPYLEVHHVIPLSSGGPDTTQNTVALCPNCHREIHHGKTRDVLVRRLYESVMRLHPYTAQF